jgi:hypothetical protein
MKKSNIHNTALTSPNVKVGKNIEKESVIAILAENGGLGVVEKESHM